ncbi:conjugal transfer protein, partial [Actinomadura sp. KC345]|uniref:conjugal transfer protein n=1 Tax=Actinomadura sp. KC345 TaxID=2530371 RepID=UPI0010531825
AVLWALIIVILVNGIRAPFERFTAEETSGGATPASKPARGAGFPSSAAGAFALQFANVYLNYDQNNAPARETQLRTFLPDGADPQFGWNGVGRMQVQSVEVAGVDVRDANHATVTLSARTADTWLRLAVPVYADKSGSLVVSAQPAMLPPPTKAQLPQGGAPDRDSALESELQPFLGTFFQEYATGNQEALSRFSDGTTITGMANTVKFMQVKEVVAPKGSAGERTITATVAWQPAAGGGGELDQTYQLAMVKRGDKWLVRDIRGTTRPNAS